MVGRRDEDFMGNVTVHGYDQARFCLEGHLRCSAILRTQASPEPYCTRCGAQTIEACSACGEPIRGDHFRSGVGITPLDPLDASYCSKCAAAYPWTEKRLEVAKELAVDLDTLESVERQELARLIDDVIRDTPRAAVAARRMKQLMEKAGYQTADVFKGVLIGALSRETAHLIWGL